MRTRKHILVACAGFLGSHLCNCLAVIHGCPSTQRKAMFRSSG